MSHLLWKYYWENDVEKFRRLLGPAGTTAHTTPRNTVIGQCGGSFPGTSPVGHGSSPNVTPRPRKVSGYTSTPGKLRDSGVVLGRNDINSRDHVGLTVLLRAASSTHANARDFVQALLEHPSLDLYIKDPENGWNALHRSLYAGNISIARLLLAQERLDLLDRPAISSVGKIGQLIKTKDHEGNSPFDLYNSTIATRILHETQVASQSDDDSDIEEGIVADSTAGATPSIGQPVVGHEVFMFGSNKNMSLGVGDEDDRQYPERIILQRPDELVHKLHSNYLQDQDLESSSSLPDLEDIPTLVRNSALTIRDVTMAKLHTAIITDDPASNLYICGVGRGGRLGLGDENTRFKFVPVKGPFVDRKIRQTALGQNHSMAITENGELWTWGLNSDAQLGYALPPLMRSDEEPMSLSPRQVFGPLKKENVLGIAASSVHSVAHTGASLYCWGRNLGQLALMDADSRSLEVQQTPRRVAASVISAPIEMVSAIDKATSCLLSNFSVWVFTNYGYNLVKFPFPDLYGNQSLASKVSIHSRQYNTSHRTIRYISSGGETIAAITSHGDLYTMQLNHKSDASQPAGSTTNPVKIKSALSQPQCIWDARKDGVASVNIGEHGSVIICTESGAVWKRVKRAKGRITAYSTTSDSGKSFKFERIPYITNCVAVRSSQFGAFSAVRQDNNIMSTNIKVAEQSLWNDVGSLICLQDFKASIGLANGMAQRPWDTPDSGEKRGSIPYEILSSLNLEEDLLQWLGANTFLNGDFNMEIRTSSSPDLKLPVHSWLLAGRSLVLREVLSEYALNGHTNAHPDVFLIEQEGNKTLLTMMGIDVLTMLNFLVFSYMDVVIPVWKYTRQAPSSAYRYRQVRLELMKIGSRLRMPNLEAAARLQAGVKPSLDSNMRGAIEDPTFFNDADMIIELDGDEILAHSQIICLRCPFFEGMFHGRSQGKWLTKRRSVGLDTDLIRVNLKHVNPDTFRYVMQYLYADVGGEMFNDVCMDTLDDFSELVLDVMSVANELMLDRLSQVCQCLLGKFVTTRNIANLLNEISPCSVTEFKDVGLEYICLQLESMLENHLLDGLEEDLLVELDEVVRNNQLARLPFARSGRSELLLHEQHPDLAFDIEEERRRRVKDMAFKMSQRDEERKLFSSFNARVGTFEESFSPAPTFNRAGRRSRAGRGDPLSPLLRPKNSLADLIFDMDDEDKPKALTSLSQERLDMSDDTNGPPPDNMVRSPDSWRDANGKWIADLRRSPPLNSSPLSQLPGPSIERGPLISSRQPGSSSPRPGPGSAPWAPTAMSVSKLDLKDIMQETTSKSALTAGLASRTGAAASSKPQARMSQKERKKQQQQQAEADAALAKVRGNTAPWEMVKSEARPAPWKTTTSIPKPPQKDAMQPESLQRERLTIPQKPLVAAERNQNEPKRRTASPDTRFPGQGRSNSSPVMPSVQACSKKRIVPHSKSYITSAPKAEFAMGTSMADIIGQQQLEQQRVKEAVAKRSLQEIQEEQAFQEWWDQESRRTQEEEARRQSKVKNKDQGGGYSRRSRKAGGGKSKITDTPNGRADKCGETAAKRTGTTSGSVSSRGKGPKSRGGQ